MKYRFIGGFCQYFTLAKYQIYNLVSVISINVGAWSIFPNSGRRKTRCLESSKTIIMWAVKSFGAALLPFLWPLLHVIAKLIRFVVHCTLYPFDVSSFFAKLCREREGGRWGEEGGGFCLIDIFIISRKKIAGFLSTRPQISLELGVQYLLLSGFLYI